MEKCCRKINRTIEVLPKFAVKSSTNYSYKPLVKPHLYYITFDEAFNIWFHNITFESIQDIACLALTWAINDTSREKLFQELGWDLLQLRRWYRKPKFSYNDYKNHSPRFIKIPTRKTRVYLQTQTTFPILTLDTISLNIFSFHGIYLNKTNGIQVSESAIATTSWRTIF